MEKVEGASKKARQFDKAVKELLVKHRKAFQVLSKY